MKKFLTPCLCIVAIAAIVLCFVFALLISLAFRDKGEKVA